MGERETGNRKLTQGLDGKLYDISLAEIKQATGGQGYTLETINWEGRGLGRRPTTFSVYVDPTVEHHYEVGRWIGGKLKDTATVSYDTHTCEFGCTCKQSREKYRMAENVRGYCQHVDELCKHNARDLPTLRAPAARIEQIQKEKPWRNTTSSTSSPVPSVEEPTSTSRTLTRDNLSAARTVSVHYMPETPVGRGR